MSSDSLTTHLSDAERERAKRVILFTVFLDILGFGIIIPQLGVYAAQFGATPQMAGFLASTYSAMTFLFTPFWGRLSDQYGRRPVLLVSIFGTTISHVLFALASSLPFFFAARALDGFTGANISAAQAYLSDITPPEKRSQTFGMFGAIFGIGFAAGPTIGVALSHLPGVWSGNFGLGMVSAALSLINWGLAIKFMPETLSPQIREENKAHSRSRSKLPLFAYRSVLKIGNLNVKILSLPRANRGIQTALKIPNFNLVLVIGFIATAAFATMQGQYALYVVKQYTRPAVQAEIKADPQAAGKRALELKNSDNQTAPSIASEGEAGSVSDDLTIPYPASLGGDFDLKGETPPEGLSWRHVEKLLVRPEASRSVGIIFTIIGILSLFIQGGLMRQLPKRVGEVPLVLAGTFIMAIALALIAVPFPMWWQFMVAGLLTLGNGLYTPVLTSLATQYAPDKQRGELLGIYQSTQSLGRIVGPILAGFLFGHIAAGAPFIVGGMIMMTAFFLAFKLKSTPKTSVFAAPAEV